MGVVGTPENTARAAAEAALAAIEPWDPTERAHRSEALAWVRRTAGIWRVAKPATPPEHLIAYVVLVDPTAQRCLLVDHRNARLWLPTGGHVEPGEHPLDTARREAREELGVDATLLPGLATNPLFVTRTTTVGVDAGHVDVSLWYVCAADHSATLQPDPDEFAAVRWWSFHELRAADPSDFDPHLHRFLAKLTATHSL